MSIMGRTYRVAERRDRVRRRPTRPGPRRVSAWRSISAPRLRRMSSTRPTTTRYTPTSKNRLVTRWTSPMHRQVEVPDPRLEHRPADEQRDDADARRQEQPQPEQQTGLHRGRLAELVPTAREVAHDQRDAGDEPRREPAAGGVVAAEQQEHRVDDHRVEEQADDHLEDHRPPLRCERAAGLQPLAAARLARRRRCPRRRTRRPGRTGGRQPQRGHRVGRAAPDPRSRFASWARKIAPRPTGQEDERRDAGRGHQQHRDLAHRVPGADVDEGDVDDVLPPPRPRPPRRSPWRPAGGSAPSGTTSATPATTSPTASPIASRTHRLASQRAVGEVRRQPAQDQHEDDERHGLDEHLGQREVGCTVQQVQARHARNRRRRAAAPP